VPTLTVVRRERVPKTPPTNLFMGQTVSSPSPIPEPSSCPMHREPPVSASILHNPPTPAQCPINHGQNLNPLNQMPNLAQAHSPNQSTILPLSRTESSIPRDPSAKWEYPSPQQFYNALVRKGWETPEEHIETMVEIHNFLNEEAWQEVLKWEKRNNRHVFETRGKPLCSHSPYSGEEPHLARFKGRPGEMSPKARLWLLAGWLLPSRFK
jgi:cytochrome c heme-lyase